MPPKTEIRKCIYCLREYLHSRRREDSHFSAEHVIHRGMTGGVRGNNPTLIGLVCGNCNGKLGKQLDQQFQRSGYIGMLRFEAAQKCPDRFNEFNSESLTLTAHRRDEKAIHGVPVKTFVRDGKLKREFVYACAIDLPSGTHYLTEEQIDNGNVPEIGNEQFRFRMMCDPDDESGILKKLQRHYRLIDTGGQWTIGVTPVLAEGEFGVVEIRCLAKIAFNYLAYVCDQVLKRPDIPFDKCFHEIRNFVGYGLVPAFTPARIERPDAHPDDGVTEPPERTKHEICLRQTEGEIFCVINLFNSLTWRVTLTRSSMPHWNAFNETHVWDLKTGTCEHQQIIKSGPLTRDISSDALKISEI